jgi:PAS domain S-box-containing protein
MTSPAAAREAPCGLLSTRPDGMILCANDVLLGWLGQSAEQLAGRRFADLLSPASRIYHETHYVPLLHTRDAVRDVALDLVRDDGSRLPVLVSATLRRDAAHAPAAVRITILDATERRDHERMLLEASQRRRQRHELAELLKERR